MYELYVELLDAKSADRPKYVYKHFTLPNAEIVSIRESPNIISEGTTGLHCWQAAGALAEWALANADRLATKNVLELGSGTGLTGFVVGKYCKVSRICLTDGNETVLRLLDDNLAENFQHNPALTINVAPLDWFKIEKSQFIADDTWKPDVVMAADVVYDDSLFEALCKTIDLIFRKCSNRCWMVMACTIRNERTLKHFLTRLDLYQFQRSLEEFVPPTHLYWDASTPIQIYRITRS